MKKSPSVKRSGAPSSAGRAGGVSGVPGSGEARLGVVTHYYNHLGVAVVKLEQGVLNTGDLIHIQGHTTNLQQRVDSMEIDHQAIPRASAGQEFGMKVGDHVREHDVVYKVRT